MVFSIKNNLNSRLVNYRYLSRVKLNIFRYKFGPNEIVLDKYLSSNYKVSLRQACILLYKNSFINEADNEILITFKTKQLDDLATLITYGNGKIQGSNILKYAFNR